MSPGTMNWPVPPIVAAPAGPAPAAAGPAAAMRPPSTTTTAFSMAVPPGRRSVPRTASTGGPLRAGGASSPDRPVRQAVASASPPTSQSETVWTRGVTRRSAMVPLLECSQIVRPALRFRDGRCTFREDVCILGALFRLLDAAVGLSQTDAQVLPVRHPMRDEGIRLGHEQHLDVGVDVLRCRLVRLRRDDPTQALDGRWPV